MKYTEDTLKRWTQPASDSEEDKISNTISMIKSAINSSSDLNALDIEIFVQGSYANKTNVRTNSDVDVCVMLKSTFFTSYPEGKTDSDYGFVEGSITYSDYKSLVKDAIIKKFGASSVTIGNKSLKVSSNSYHVDADVVVAFMLKDYSLIGSANRDRYIEGIKFFASDGQEVRNYPKDHIENGKSKNKSTNHRYKYLTRIMKRIRNNMVEDYIIDGNVITSFLVECLVWNTPNRIITGYSSWIETVKQTIVYLYNEIDSNNHTEWGEVSEHLYLFRARKWTDMDAKTFLNKMWNYMEYDA